MRSGVCVKFRFLWWISHCGLTEVLTLVGLNRWTDGNIANIIKSDLNLSNIVLRHPWLACLFIIPVTFSSFSNAFSYAFNYPDEILYSKEAATSTIRKQTTLVSLHSQLPLRMAVEVSPQILCFEMTFFSYFNDTNPRFYIILSRIPYHYYNFDECR